MTNPIGKASKLADELTELQRDLRESLLLAPLLLGLVLLCLAAWAESAERYDIDNQEIISWRMK